MQPTPVTKLVFAFSGKTCRYGFHGRLLILTDETSKRTHFAIPCHRRKPAHSQDTRTPLRRFRERFIWPGPHHFCYIPGVYPGKQPPLPLKFKPITHTTPPPVGCPEATQFSRTAATRLAYHTVA